MSQLVLYRKYRPTKFSEIVGQAQVVRTLVGALVSGRVSHGYLFTGPRGTGKTTMARILAKAVNCENRTEKEHEPCNECQSCREFSNLSAMDLIEIDAASNRGIDDIRDLKEGIRFVPSRAKFKVFIIDEAHMLTKEANNALLKTLEEPPDHAIFILATTEVEKIPATIISRVQKFDFRKFSAEDMAQKLNYIIEKENVKTNEEALQLIIQAAEGGMRDAESLLDQIISFEGRNFGAKEVEQLLGVVNFKTINEFMKIIAGKDAPKAINYINGINDAGYDMREFAKAVIQYLRKLLLIKIDEGLDALINKELTQRQLEDLKLQAQKFTLLQVRHLIDHFLQARELMAKTSHLVLPMEIATISFLEEGKQ